MVLARLFHPTNRRIRLLVGTVLLGLFCIQCTRDTEAFKPSSNLVVAIAGEAVGANSSEVLARVNRLARSDHVALLEYCLENYRGRFSDYQCTLVKQERIRGKLRHEQWVKVKFTEEPFSVAMAWTKNPPPGDRLLYVKGKYDDKMLVRPTSGLLRALTGGSVLRQPDGADAMANTLRPVSMFGFENALKSLLKVYHQAGRNGDLRESFGGYADVAGRETLILIRHLPAKNDYPACRTLVYIDLEYLVPICIEGFGWEDSPQLICRYLYKDLKFNVGLDADDFLPEANDIRPPK